MPSRLLYKIQKGKRMDYAYKEQEMDALRAEYKDGYKVQRYKGLGEMDAEQLWETTMDPERRILKRVTIEDAMDGGRYLCHAHGRRRRTP